MPRRWLSVRGRKEEQKPGQDIGEAHLQKDFDFAFAAEKIVQGGSHVPPSTEELRPTTSGGERYKAKRKPDLTLHIERPKSSDSVQKKPLSAVRLDNPQIGLAFGSPRHPPQVLESIASTMSPSHQHQAFFLEGPLPIQPAKAKKWKIGGFFRPRANSHKEPTFYQVQQVNTVETKKLGLPIIRTPWRNPKSPPMVQDSFKEQTQSPVEGDDSKADLPSTSATEKGRQHEDSPLLKSGLLVRRSKDLDQLLITTVHNEQSNILTVPKLARRATSPTTSKYQDTSRTCSHGPASSKYSLFPSTPTSSRFLPQTDSPGSTRVRSATGPPQVSPAQGNYSASSEGHRTGVDQQHVSSAHRCEKSTDSKLSNTSTNVDHSRVSSQSEIFFDVKSFRDSKGQVGQQFEMTRPPSVAVQLARSKSNARKLLQEKLNVKPHAQDQEIKGDREERTTSIEIDETIAIVESLTSPSGPVPALQRLQPTTYNPECSCDDKQEQEQGDGKIYAMDAESATTKKAKRKSELRSRLDGLNIDVPSPVLEQVEESTPWALGPVTPKDSVKQTPEQIVSAVVTPALTPTASSPSRLTETPSPPPVVPIKDSKYIPLSKYAPKRTTEDLVRQTGLRPVRSNRSNTDNTTTWNARSSSLRRPPFPERSATVPPLNPIPQAKHNALPPPVVAGSGKKATGPSMVAYIKPAAEVSVARTVSLSRKPSARVIGPKFPTRSASRKEQVQEELKEKKVTLGVPVVQEVHKGHKPGLSQEVVLETATIAPSSPPPPLPSPIMFTAAPTEPPPPIPVGAR